MNCVHHSPLSIYDIGRINFHVKKFLLEMNVLNAILSSDIIKEGKIQSNSSVIFETNMPMNIQSVKFTVTSVLLDTIMGMQPKIMDALISLGYNNPNVFYDAIVNRIDMLYTVLQISNNEFSIILI